jgi:LDH2 family malate/lactate/ureidoglycolate dehydrogenase
MGAGESTDADRVYVSCQAATAFAEKLLVAHGLPAKDAALAAYCLVRADLRGVSTHGLLRLPGYLERIRRGLINSAPSLAVEPVTSVVAALDGQNALGFVVATKAMSAAIDMAEESGVGVVGVRRSTHFGMASLYVLQAIDAQKVSLVFTNASRAMPPWGGREAFLGTGPLAAGAPGGSLNDFVLDMSPAVAARGKIRLAARLGQPIPEGYALNSDGCPTTDPVAALGGVVLPIAGPKGSGLAIMMDVFAGVVSGAAFAGAVRDQYKDFDEPQNVGHFFFAMRPDLFVTAHEYSSRLDTLVRKIHSTPLSEGFNEILLPGEIESRCEVERSQTGIPYNQAEIAPLHAEGAAIGLEPLELSPAPLPS